MVKNIGFKDIIGWMILGTFIYLGFYYPIEYGMYVEWYGWFSVVFYILGSLLCTLALVKLKSSSIDAKEYQSGFLLNKKEMEDAQQSLKESQEKLDEGENNKSKLKISALLTLGLSLSLVNTGLMVLPILLLVGWFICVCCSLALLKTTQEQVDKLKSLIDNIPTQQD